MQIISNFTNDLIRMKRILAAQPIREIRNNNCAQLKNSFNSFNSLLKRTYLFFFIFYLLFSPIGALRAQSAFELISRHRNLSASNYCIYPDSILEAHPALTPAPEGKKPFYLSHYGRHGSRYLSNRIGYDIPYGLLSRADSMQLLTTLGQQVKQELKDIIDDSEGRWGDLTGLGKQQHRNIAHRMTEHFPEVFSGKAFIDARSTTVNRCILSMGSALQELMSLNPRLQVTMQATRRDMHYMNHQDKALRGIMKNDTIMKAFRAFCRSREQNPRLMALLINNPDSALNSEQQVLLNYYLLKTALIQQNTHMQTRTTLIDLFTYEEIHQFWQMENVWWYLTYGPTPISGSRQPYSQRYLLRQLIADADSIIRQPRHGAQLRFGHETVILPLTCLLGINGFDTAFDDLEQLEPSGWWACLVFPMASNLQFVFYRSDPADTDVLVKVLLNEQETWLPLPADNAPYYRWSDFRDYYLRKLDAYGD